MAALRLALVALALLTHLARADDFDQSAGPSVMIHQEAAPEGMDAWCVVLGGCLAP